MKIYIDGKVFDSTNCEVMMVYLTEKDKQNIENGVRKFSVYAQSSKEMSKEELLNEINRFKKMLKEKDNSLLSKINSGVIYKKMKQFFDKK